MNSILEREKKGSADTNSFMNYIVKKANDANKSYFLTVLVGYLVAIVTTVIVMIIFDHG